ncbi:MAG TPA: helix-turn-helix domain-containing protein [Acidimicrobiales bacterium]|nr:helix-turn-helix domain-containing protein [Acidimicrobiales bacterium]
MSSAPADTELTDRLLAAAAEVFAERGYDKAGVAEIARRAGVTTGAIYSRFSGKADLLVEALDPHASDELDKLFADHHFQGRMEDILLAAGSSLVKDPSLGTSTLLLEAMVAGRRNPEMAEVLRNRVLERQDRLQAIVEAAKGDGGIDDGFDTDALVTFCHAVGFGFLLLDVLDLPLPTPGPWEDLIAHLVASLRPQSETQNTKGDPQ